MKAAAKQKLWDVETEMSIKQSKNVPASKMVPDIRVKLPHASVS